MFGDLAAGAKPDTLARAHMLEDLDQSDRAAGAPCQAIVQVDGHQPGMLGAFLVHELETIDQIGRELVGGAETARQIETIVVGFE
jgi:hypothetical protein